MKELTPIEEAIEKVNKLAMDDKTIRRVLLILNEQLKKEQQVYKVIFQNGLSASKRKTKKY